MDSVTGTASTLPLEWVLTLDVAIGEGQNLGACAAGQRANYPIVGGHFVGHGLRGEVLPGGADFFVQRLDGVGEMDASYSLRTDQGELINIRNRGFLKVTEEGQRLEATGLWPLPETLYHCTCTPVFQAPTGRLHWLTESAFIGQVSYPDAQRVVIRVYRLLGR